MRRVPFNPFIACMVIGLLALVLTGCGAGATPAPPFRNAPTLTAPAWTTGGEPINLENVTSLRYMGRIDPPDVVATWFDLAFSPDSTALAAINVDQLASWDILTGAVLFYSARGGVIRVYYSPDKTELYGVTESGEVSVYNALTGQQTASFNGHAAFAGVSAFHADSGHLALGGADGTIKVWDTFSRTALATFDAHAAPLSALTFAPAGDLLASAAGDGWARVWDWQSRTLAAGVEAANIARLTFAPVALDAWTLALGTATNALLWTPDAAPAALDSEGSDVLLFSPDGRYLLAGSRSDGLTLWDGENGQFVGRLPDTAGDGTSAAFSPDGALLVTSTLNGGVFLWNLNALTDEDLNQAALNTGTRQIQRVAWSPDGRLLLFFDAVGAVYVWGIG